MVRRIDIQTNDVLELDGKLRISGGMRDGRILSRQSPAAPWSRNRSCRRQITVLALPVANDLGSATAIGCQKSA
jgi:hypothetical protein